MFNKALSTNGQLHGASLTALFWLLGIMSQNIPKSTGHITEMFPDIFNFWLTFIQCHLQDVAHYHRNVVNTTLASLRSEN
jgi:hypothetical protein